MYIMPYLSGFISWGDFIVRLLIKNAFFYKYWKRLLVKRLLAKRKKSQFCIECESNKYMLRISFLKKFDVLIIPVAIGSLYTIS